MWLARHAGRCHRVSPSQSSACAPLRSRSVCSINMWELPHGFRVEPRCRNDYFSIAFLAAAVLENSATLSLNLVGFAARNQSKQRGVTQVSWSPNIWPGHTLNHSIRRQRPTDLARACQYRHLSPASRRNRRPHSRCGHLRFDSVDSACRLFHLRPRNVVAYYASHCAGARNLNCKEHPPGCPAARRFYATRVRAPERVPFLAQYARRLY